eukprot:403361753
MEENQPKKRLRRNDENAESRNDDQLPIIMKNKNQVQTKQPSSGQTSSQFGQSIGGTANNLQRNQFAANKASSGTDFYANLADAFFGKPKVSTNAQSIYGGEMKQSSITANTINPFLPKSSNSRINSLQSSNLQTSSLVKSNIGSMVSSNSKNLAPNSDIHKDSKKRKYEEYQSTNSKQTHSNQGYSSGLGGNSSTLGATNQLDKSNSRKNSLNSHSSSASRSKNGQQFNTFKGVGSKNNYNSSLSQNTANTTQRRRLRRKDQEKDYDDEKQEDINDEIDEFEDGEAEFKAQQKKRLQKGGKGKKKSRGGVDDEDYGPEASADEEEGGSSQDNYESDFINDNKVEYESDHEQNASASNNPKESKKTDNKVKHGQTVLKNRLHSSEDEYYSKSQNSADENEEDDTDIYDTLDLAPDEKEGGFKYDRVDNLYYLRDGFCLPDDIYNNLFPHQRIGIKWLYDLYRDSKGGILGDDMGLGKTVQVCVYLRGLFESEQIKKAIIVVPASLKSYWHGELQKWCSNAPNFIQFEEKKKNEREKQLKTLKKKGGVLITSYGMVTSEKINLQDMRYDIVVVDEGHKAKNINTELRRNLVALRSKGHKLLLSGTPLQNNLLELWSVFDFVQPKIFGSQDKFKKEFADPIEKGLLKDANAREKQKSQSLSDSLRKMYESQFLRRTKNQIFTVVSAELLGRSLKNHELPVKTDLVVWLPLSDMQQRIYKFILENQTLQQLIEERVIKNAFFVLSYIKKLCQHPYLLTSTSAQKRRKMGLLMSEEQEMLEKLEREDQEKSQVMAEQSRIKTRRAMEEAKKKQKKQIKVLEEEKKQKEVDDETLKSLNELNKSNKNMDDDGEWEYNADAMKKRLLMLDENKRLKIEEEMKLKETQKLKEVEVQQENVNKLHQTFGLEKIITEIQETFNNQDIEAMIAQSTKCAFLFKLMAELKREGHRLLVFSMSKKMLNIIEGILKNDKYKEDYKYLRIDGDTEIASREQICHKFNDDPSIFCCLLTTKVGGFGLNLTGANRVVILDPDWNPANDNQAVDRVSRIGQKRDVIVYRLVSSNGIEEKIYRRQIYKRGINLQTIETSDTSGIPQAGDGKNTSDLMKYFGDSDLFELFEFDYDSKKCETLDLLLERDGFNYFKTPTNDRHIAFLKSLKDIVTGLSLNSNLYSNSGEAEVPELKPDHKPSQQNQIIQNQITPNKTYHQTDEISHIEDSGSNVAYVYKQTKRLVKMVPNSTSSFNQVQKMDLDSKLSTDQNKFGDLDKFACSSYNQGKRVMSSSLDKYKEFK